jgi:hypothetical protein
MSDEHPTSDELVREALAGLMPGISEYCWCAGWMRDFEFSLWDVLATGRTNPGSGMRECGNALWSA